MAKTPPERPAPRLYLATPIHGDPQTLLPALIEAAEAADIAALLFTPTVSDERGIIRQTKSVAEAVQPRGIALLQRGYSSLVARAGADGCHLDGVAALREAIGGLHPDRIAGVGALTSRHDAMVAGERGADYVLFGEPDEDGRRPPLPAIAERVAWWAQVFEPPCVGYAAALDEVGPLARAGADFVLVGDAIWNDPRGVRAAIVDAAAALRQSDALVSAGSAAP